MHKVRLYGRELAIRRSLVHAASAASASAAAVVSAAENASARAQAVAAAALADAAELRGMCALVQAALSVASWDEPQTLVPILLRRLRSAPSPAAAIKDCVQPLEAMMNPAYTEVDLEWITRVWAESVLYTLPGAAALPAALGPLVPPVPPAGLSPTLLRAVPPLPAARMLAVHSLVFIFDTLNTVLKGGFGHHPLVSHLEWWAWLHLDCVMKEGLTTTLSFPSNLEGRD